MTVRRKLNGSGRLQILGAPSISCSFILRQYSNGEVIAECRCAEPWANFVLWGGQIELLNGTINGEDVFTCGPIHIRALRNNRCSLRLSSIQVGTASSSISHDFSLTNFVFPNTRLGQLPDPERMTLQSSFGPVDVSIGPAGDYERRQNKLRLFGGPECTATLRIRSTMCAHNARRLANDLCYAISVVQGNKVNWVDHIAISRTQSAEWLFLASRVTKPYIGLALDQSRGNKNRMPLSAIPDVYRRVCIHKALHGWHSRLIDSWLDARTDIDFLESRALKFVVVIETLRTLVLGNSSAREHLDVDRWNRLLQTLLPYMRDVMSSDLSCSKAEVAVLTDPQRWLTLNRKSFRSDISKVLRELKVDMRAREIELFVKSRNKLIHEGTFRVNAEPIDVAAEPDTPQTAVDEYLFIAGFVDRVIMQLFGLRPTRPNFLGVVR